MKKVILIVICCLLLMIGCESNNNDNLNNNELNSSIEEKDNKKKELEMSDIKVIINEKTYTLKLDNSKTSEEFVNLLPLEFNMSELNGNEKYIYMNNSLTTNAYNPKHIEKGDVMLYGNNCLVIFYKSFDTNYSYTKIGHIDNLDDLENGTTRVIFKK